MEGFLEKCLKIIMGKVLNYMKLEGFLEKCMKKGISLKLHENRGLS